MRHQPLECLDCAIEVLWHHPRRSRLKAHRRIDISGEPRSVMESVHIPGMHPSYGLLTFAGGVKLFGEAFGVNSAEVMKLISRRLLLIQQMPVYQAIKCISDLGSVDAHKRGNCLGT